MRERAREGVKVGEHLRVGHVRRVALRHKDEIHAGRELTAAMPNLKAASKSADGVVGLLKRSWKRSWKVFDWKLTPAYARCVLWLPSTPVEKLQCSLRVVQLRAPRRAGR